MNLNTTKENLCYLVFYISVALVGLHIVLALYIIMDCLGLVGFIYAYIKKMIDFTPNIGFISDLVVFEVGVFAFVVPLSFEVISRISERYQSETISKRFIKEKVVIALPFLTLVNAFIAIVLRFFSDTILECDKQIPMFWILGSYIVLFFLFTSALLLIYFLLRAVKYATDTDFIMEQLLNDAQNSIR